MPVTPAAASFPASPVERGRVEDLLKEAYVDGRIDRVEFESRMGAALAAHTRSELTACCAGLAPRATAPRTALVASAAPDGTGLGVLAHLLPFVSWIFGPLLLWALAAPGTFARKQAARAFNWQLTSSVVLLVLGIVSGVTDLRLLDQFTGLWWVAWLVLTIVGAVRAGQGRLWTNPVMRVLRWNVLDPNGR